MPGPRPRHERVAARVVTGPVGHFACGLADWVELLGRHLLARLLRRAA